MEKYQSRVIRSCRVLFLLFCDMKFLQEKKAWLCTVLHFQLILFFWWKTVPSEPLSASSAACPFWARFIPSLNTFPCNRDSPKAPGRESKQPWVLQSVAVTLARRVRCPVAANPAWDVTLPRCPPLFQRPWKEPWWTELNFCWNHPPARFSLWKRRGLRDLKEVWARWNEKRGENRQHAWAGEALARWKE